MCRAVAEANPLAIGALARLSDAVPVTLVLGNHDRHLSEPGAAEALAAIGLGRVRIERRVVRRMGSRSVVLLHGHGFDPGNARPDGGGEALTAALQHAVVPFLRARGSRPNVRADPDRLVALRPEGRIFSVLQRWLEPRSFRRFLSAFLALLAANGGVPALLGLLAPLVPVALVRWRVRREDDLRRDTGLFALAALAGRLFLPGRAPRPDLLVMGHTHVLDWAVQSSAAGDRLYVNLGTWTDRAFDAASPPDHSLPLLAVGPEGGELVATLRDLSEPERELQRYAVPLERRGP